MKNLILFLTLLLISSVTICEEKFISEKKILILNDNNFDEAIQKCDYLLVLFYLPFNQQCKKFLIELQKASQILSKENIFISKIDASSEKNIRKKYNINEYPGVLFFIKGDKIKYNGGSKSSGIVNWV